MTKISAATQINIAEPFLGGNELEYVTRCIETNWISSRGEFVTEFENSFAEYVDSPYAVSTSNGTTALHLALAAIGVGIGDEVLVPNLTFAATANVVLHAGATPVLVDIDCDDWTIDITDVENKITPWTKAIIPVHLYGGSCQMDALVSIARHHGLFLIEDGAEALGAKYKGSVLGTMGDIGCFSFFANKVMTTGEGGMVVTSDPTLFERLRVLRDHGMEAHKRYWHIVPGFNFRLTNLQAAVGLAQLQQLEGFLERRKNIASYYSNGLSEISGIRTQKYVDGSVPVCWLYSLVVDPKLAGVTRDGLREILAASGIETRPFFYPLDRQPPYSKYRVGNLANSNWVADNGLSLPTHMRLSETDIVFICDQIRSASSR